MENRAVSRRRFILRAFPVSLPFSPATFFALLVDASRNSRPPRACTAAAAAVSWRVPLPPFSPSPQTPLVLVDNVAATACAHPSPPSLFLSPLVISHPPLPLVALACRRRLIWSLEPLNGVAWHSSAFVRGRLPRESRVEAPRFYTGRQVVVRLAGHGSSSSNESHASDAFPVARALTLRLLSCRACHFLRCPPHLLCSSDRRGRHRAACVRDVGLEPVTFVQSAV